MMDHSPNSLPPSRQLVLEEDKIRRDLDTSFIADSICAAGDVWLDAYRTKNVGLLGEMLIASVEASIQNSARYSLEQEVNADAESDAAAQVLDAYRPVLLLESVKQFRRELAA